MGLEQTSPKKGGPSSRWELRVTGKMNCSGERARTASESPAPREHLENLGWAGLLLIWPEINKSAASSPWVYGALTGSLRDHALPCLKRSWGQYSFPSEVEPQPVCVSQPSSDQTTGPVVWSGSLLGPLVAPHTLGLLEGRLTAVCTEPAVRSQ